MSDIRKTQSSFARKALAVPGRRFGDLYHLICRDEWLAEALSSVLRNTGSRTPGVDSVVVSTWVMSARSGLHPRASARAEERCLQATGGVTIMDTQGQWSAAAVWHSYHQGSRRADGAQDAARAYVGE